MESGVLSQNALYQLSHIESEDDVSRQLHNIAGTLGFDFFLYAEVPGMGKQNSVTKILSSYPREWRLKYDSQNYIAIDPVMEHCEHRLVPVIWKDIERQSARQREFMEEARGFGLVTGISFPNHWKSGDIGVLSFASGSTSVFSQAGHRLDSLTMAQGALTAAFMHDAMERLLNKNENLLRAPLTTREIECLKWIAKGKTTWEISAILGISEHGVLFHIRNLMLKFNAPSRHVAVLRAMACDVL